MKDFASRLTARAHEVSCEVTQLLHDSQLTDAKIQSVTDYFLTLSDSQFIENRVYDEDDSVKEEEAEKKEETAKTKEQLEAEMLSRMKEAVGFGLGVIEDAYDVLDVKIMDSDSEDDDEDSQLPSNEVILEPKDLYVTRPLPYLIGSRGFHEEDDVGVGDLIDSDDVESEAGSVSESEDEIEKPPSVSDVSSSDYDSEDDLSDQSDLSAPVVKQKATSFSSDNSLTSSEEEVLFAEENDSTDENVPAKTKVSSKKRSKPPQPAQDMFGQEEEEIFAGSGGLFGKTSGLFDTPKEGGGLFDGVDSFDDDDDDDASDSEKEPAEEEKPVPTQKPKSKKLPHGGISLFGGAIKKGFFKGEEPSGSDGDQEVAVTTKSKEQKSDLFDGEESDEEDLFAEKNKPSKKETVSKPAPVKSGGLFDETDEDDEEEDDMFKDMGVKETPPEEPISKPKKPVGGVSMFGGGGNVLQDAIRRRAPSSTSEGDSRVSNNVDSAKRKQSLDHKRETPNKKSSLFSGSSDEDLFGSKSSSQKKTKQIVKPQKKQETPKKKGSLFGSSSDEDLFGSSTKNSTVSDLRSTSMKSASSNSSLTSRKSHQNPLKKDATSLFGGSSDDDDDDLFSTSKKSSNKKSSNNPSPLITGPTKIKKGVKNGSKNNLLGDSDNDNLLSNSRTKSSFTSKSQSRAPESLLSDSDDDDLFGKKSSSKPSAVKAPVQSKSTKSVPKPTKKSSLFDKSDDNVEVTNGHSPAKVTPGQPKKKAASTKPSLFAESESDDDLFSGMSKAKPAPVKSKATNKTKVSIPKTDLFGGSDSDDSFKKPIAKPAAAPVKKKKELFGSDDDDEDLFGDSSTKKVPPPKIKQDTSGDEDDDLHTEEVPSEEEVAPKKKLAGAVSMFGAGGGELLAAISKRRSASQKSDVSINSEKEVVIPSKPDVEEEDDGLFGKDTVNPPITNVTAKPFSLSTSTKPGFAKVSLPSAKPSSNVNKLKAGISFNPSALLPGAAPVIKSSVDVDATLESTTKTRSKGQSGRRPPTRRARRQIAAASQNDIVTSSPFADDVSASTSSTVAVATTNKASSMKSEKETPKDDFFDDLFTSKPTQKSSSSPSVKKKTKLPGIFDDDLFDPVEKSSSKKVEADIFESPDVVSSSKRDVFSDPVSESSIFDDVTTQPKKKKHNLFADDLFGDDDVTEPTTNKTKKPPLKLDDDDDLFGDELPVASSKKQKSSKKPDQNGGDFLFADITSSPVTKKKTKGKSSKIDDLFADDDIFADLPASKPKGKKSQKKTTKPDVTSSIFDEDDIFAASSSKTPQEKAKKTKKSKTSKKPPPTKDDGDIFDDPLSALLGP